MTTRASLPVFFAFFVAAPTLMTGCEERPGPTPPPTLEQRLAELAELSREAPARGPADAPVTVVEFSDFQCSYCRRAAATLDPVLEAYPGQVRLVHLDYPLSFHAWAWPAAVAGVCAARQSPEAFWTMRDGLFADQPEIDVSNVLDRSSEILSATGLDLDLWNECARQADSSAHRAAVQRVDRQIEGALYLGVEATPTFFFNGEPLVGAQPAEVFDRAVQEALAQGQQEDTE